MKATRNIFSEPIQSQSRSNNIFLNVHTMVNSAYEKLLKDIRLNPSLLLPSTVASQNYSLRPKTHNITLPKQNSASTDYIFLTPVLFMNMYWWISLFYTFVFIRVLHLQFAKCLINEYSILFYYKMVSVHKAIL